MREKHGEKDLKPLSSNINYVNLLKNVDKLLFICYNKIVANITKGYIHKEESNMKEKMCPVFEEYVEKLVYSIDHIDWREERSRKLMILMDEIDKEYKVSCFIMSEFKRAVDKELDNFEKGKICEEELIRRLINVKNSKL